MVFVLGLMKYFMNKMLEILFFIVGLIHVTYFIWGLVGLIRKHCFLKRHEMLTRYGEGSWALVTGASDGIGAEYCIQLAREGFNICLVSRTRAKLEAVEKKIKAATKVQTCLIQFDFEGATSME